MKEINDLKVELTQKTRQFISVNDNLTKLTDTQLNVEAELSNAKKTMNAMLSIFQSIKRKINELSKVSEEDSYGLDENAVAEVGAFAMGKIREHETKYILLLQQVQNDLSYVEENGFDNIISTNISGKSNKSKKRKNKMSSANTMESSDNSNAASSEEFEALQNQMVIMKNDYEAKLESTKVELKRVNLRLKDKDEQLKSLSEYRVQVGEMNNIIINKDKEIESVSEKWERELANQRMKYDLQSQKIRQMEDNSFQQESRERELDRVKQEQQEREELLNKRSNDLAVKEQENAGMLDNIYQTIKEQSKIDAQTQEELQRGFASLREQFAKLANQEQELHKFKAGVDQQELNHNKIGKELNMMKERLILKDSEISSRERKTLEFLKEKHSELNNINTVIKQKQMDFQQLQLRTHEIHDLVNKFRQREQEFESKERLFEQNMAIKRKQLDELENSINDRRKLSNKLQQMINMQQKQTEQIKKSQLQNKIQQWKEADTLQRRKSQIDIQQSQIEEQKRSLQQNMSLMQMMNSNQTPTGYNSSFNSTPYATDGQTPTGYTTQFTNNSSYSTPYGQTPTMNNLTNF